MAEEKMEKKTSNAASILANDTAPKSSKTAGAGMPKDKPAAGAAPKQHEAAAGGKRKHKHTHIEHHENGTHTVRHTPVGGGEDTSYAAQDLDGVHDGLEHHVGEPNGGEGAAEPQEADVAAGGAQPGGQPDAAAAGAQPQPGAQPQAV